MAPPSMFWRYLTLTLLLGIPSSHIFSSATYNNPSENDSGRRLSDKQLIDKIVNQLTRQQLEEAARSKVFQSPAEQGGNPQGFQDEQNGLDGLGSRGKNDLSKKDEAPVSSVNQGVNLQQDAPDAKSRSPEDDASKGTSGEQGQGHGQTTKGRKEQEFGAPGKYEAHQQPSHDDEEDKHFLSRDDTTFTVFVGAGVAAGFVGLMMAGICYYKFRRNAKAASDVEYPAYGVTGPMKEKIPSPGDRKLAQSAQMYHYQHQKQQMIAMEKANGDMKHDASDDDSEEDNVEGDYTVFECPGLAPTGEMEVINPLFRGGEENAASTEMPSAPPDAGHTNQ